MTDGATLWLEGSRRRGCKTKKGQPTENVDLWQQLYDTPQGRRAEQEWVKVPSDVVLEGNERADGLVDEGVKKYGVRLAADGKTKKPAAKRPHQQKDPPGQKAKRQRVDNGPHHPEPNPQTQPPGPSLNPNPISRQDHPNPTQPQPQAQPEPQPQPDTALATPQTAKTATTATVTAAASATTAQE